MTGATVGPTNVPNGCREAAPERDTGSFDPRVNTGSPALVSRAGSAARRTQRVTTVLIGAAFRRRPGPPSDPRKAGAGRRGQGRARDLPAPGGQTGASAPELVMP
jgi:hypothetical protein